MRIAAVVITVIVWGGLLAACFHHRQTVVEYGTAAAVDSTLQIAVLVSGGRCSDNACSSRE